MHLQSEAFCFFITQEGFAEPRPLRFKREDRRASFARRSELNGLFLLSRIGRACVCGPTRQQRTRCRRA